MSLLQTVRTYAIATVGYLALKLLEATYRWDLSHYLENVPKCDGPTMTTFWHNQQIVMPKIYKMKGSPLEGRDIHVLISEHGDGRLIAALMHLLKVKSVAGSSTKGGKRAFRQLLKIIKDDNHAAFTPDGPRGPIYEVKDGVLKLSQMSGAAILPVTLQASSYWEFGSWDRMFLPKPFAKVVVTAATPWRVPREATDEDIESYRKRLKNELDDLTELARTRATGTE